MLRFNPSKPQLVVSLVELAQLAEAAAGLTSLDDISPDFEEAGIVTAEGVDPVAGSLAMVAVAPWRAAVIERFDGHKLTPLFVAWNPDGRATLSEPDDDGDVVISGTQVSLLPALLMQWLSLRSRPVPQDRRPIRTTTGVLDAAVSAGRPAEPTGDPDLDDLLDHWRLAWRANGSWGQQGCDIRLTIIDAAGLGVWMCDHQDLVDDEHRDIEVTLVPIGLGEALDGLGDVVTGRRSPAPAGAGG